MEIIIILIGTMIWLGLTLIIKELSEINKTIKKSIDTCDKLDEALVCSNPEDQPYKCDEVKGCLNCSNYKTKQ